MGVRVIAKSTLRTFWEKHTDAEGPLKAWYAEVSRAKWKGPADVRKMFNSADFVANNRVIFNIKGNNYRLVTVVLYSAQIVFIRFVGTHKQYDKIDPTTV